MITANRVLQCQADTPEEMHHWITLLQRCKGDTRVHGQEFIIRGTGTHMHTHLHAHKHIHTHTKHPKMVGCEKSFSSFLYIAFEYRWAWCELGVTMANRVYGDADQTEYVLILSQPL
jgi:hypothetical protein